MGDWTNSLLSDSIAKGQLAFGKSIHPIADSTIAQQSVDWQSVDRQWIYSLNAVTGSIRDARHAGNAVAISVTATNSITTRLSVTGSAGDTP